MGYLLRGPRDTDLWKKPEGENLVSGSLSEIKIVRNAGGELTFKKLFLLPGLQENSKLGNKAYCKLKSPTRQLITFKFCTKYFS